MRGGGGEQGGDRQTDRQRERREVDLFVGRTVALDGGTEIDQLQIDKQVDSRERERDRQTDREGKRREGV